MFLLTIAIVLLSLLYGLTWHDQSAREPVPAHPHRTKSETRPS